ncbi:MAG: 6-phosphogluconolactonase [Rhodospirillaceae bacterium]|jgi:6-phosphogluconolactonase|nr:6-phosphogluconolactonase [Rhodospirillaceae bacterium]MBT4219484.1 6-phosphogluconolactonase [Rhodospirillaceae bacterium]MBT5013654.1 6-phosphogluconolactonase [Rhodospirillaceae bacterium]MBT5309556.1 6-phosphogluconolactonase [Rhodospirillaceae bacterium]MBT7355883.1 6-phosphogluconolactonase [Rhodospirillaceae bacterium]
MTNIDELKFPDFRTAAERLADDMAAALKDAIVARGRAGIAVSGGRTPETVLPRLATAKLDWAKVDVTLIDERWVDSDHPDSNEGLALRTLLAGRAADARFVGLKVPGDDPFSALPEIEQNLTPLNWPLDAAFLGVGPDGHIASLFPDSGDWRDAPGRVLAVQQAGDRRARISLTPNALLDCRHIFLILSGAEKIAVYEAAKTPGDMLEMPLRLIMHQVRVPVTVYIAP